MSGRYNGSYMRAYKIIPLPQIKAAFLSKDALQRLAWIDWYFNHGKNAEATCRHFSLSKSVFYRWFNRFNKYNLKTLEFDTKTRRPQRLRGMITPFWIQDLVCTIRANDLEKSKYEIQAELKEQGIKIGYNTIQKIINRHPELLNTQHLKKIRSRRKMAIARIRAARELRENYPGSLVQIDTKHLYVLGKRFYLFAAVDCKSRFGFIFSHETTSSLAASDFLTRVTNHFPFTIEAVQTDNGSEYLLNFHKQCRHLGIIHYFTDPYCPKQNGRVERFIQTATYEFFNWQADLLPDIEMINQRCVIFNGKYNTKRFHQALGYKTPAMYLSEMLQKKGEQPFSIYMASTSYWQI